MKNNLLFKSMSREKLFRIIKLLVNWKKFWHANCQGKKRKGQRNLRIFESIG